MKTHTESLQIDQAQDEAASAPALDPRPVYEGDWKTATGPEKGAHAERVRLWKERQAALGKPITDGPPSGTVEPAVERDRALALRTARAIAKDGNARDADRLTAAALLSRIEEAQAAAAAPSVIALRGLDDEELEALVLAHL